MRKGYFYLLYCLLILFINNEIKAQEEDSIKNTSNNFLNSDFFSLMKKKENAFDVASSVYVVSSDDIRRSGATSIPEALRLVPGLQVARMDGNKWAISSRGFNRQFSNKLLIMIDGRTIYTPIFSGALWDNHDYVLEDIEKIEVVKGPGGAIWGANAVNGIINIITKRGVDSQGTYFSQTVGNNDKSITEARYGFRDESGKDHYKLYLKRSQRGDFNKISSDNSNNDGILSDIFGFRYDSRIDSQGGSFSLQTNFSDIKSSNFVDFASYSDPFLNNDKATKSGNILFNLNKSISKKTSYILQGYYNYESSDISILSVAEKTADIDFQLYHNHSNFNKFIIGAGYRNLQDSISYRTALGGNNILYYPLKYEPTTRNIDLFTGFVQEKLGISKDMFFTVGSKFEHNDLTGFEFQPSLKFTYYPDSNQTLWTSVSRAVRTPTRGEDSLEIRVPTQAGNVLINKGDTGFKAETVRTYEAGYRIKPTHNSLFDFSAFYSNYSKLRTFEGQSQFATPVVRNGGYGESYGFEVSAKVEASKNWKLEIGYDFLRIQTHLRSYSREDTTALNPDKLENVENQSPRNQLRFRSLYNISKNLEFDNFLYYVDSVSKARLTQSSSEKGVPSYFRWDSRIGYSINYIYDLSFGVQNILDSYHQEYSPGLFSNKTEIPRTYYIKFVAKF